MPPAEVPTGQDVATIVEDMEPLTDEQRRQISELFEDLELAHEQLARTCSSLAILSRSLTSRQLILLLKSSIRPLAQLNVAPGVFEEAKLGQQKMEQTEEKFRQVRLTMVPIATSGRLAQEKPNSVTRLLAATLSFKVLNHFTDGTTQKEQQETYGVRPKQLALCITGQKYLGGKEKVTLERKRRASGEDLKPHLQRRPT